MSVFILENLTKSFQVGKTKLEVLKNLNFSLPDKGLVSILGKSGSGKSTLLNILMGIEKPSKGNVYFNNKNIAKFNDKKFSNYHLNGVSLVFQHYNLFNDLTAIENAILPLQMRGEKTTVLKKKAHELFKQFKIETLERRKVDKLSGGEKQRVAIIRSLMTSPKAILCDEPTGALDYENSVQIMDILKEISKNTLVVMVSHNKNLVNKYSDQILCLKDGELIENETTIDNKFTSPFKNKKIKYKSSWINKFLRLNLRKDFKKNLFSVLACSVSFASMFISVGFSEGSKASQEEALRRNLSIGFATASETEFIELDGSPLQYQKTMKPSLELIDNTFEKFNSIRCEENLSYFISNYPSCSFGESTYNNFQMIPVYDITLSKYGNDLLTEGRASDGSFNEVLVNNEFKEMIGTNVLGKTITLSNFSTVTYTTGEEENPFVKDTLNMTRNLKITGVLTEFSFLNSPKIYFSYDGAREFLKTEKMENLSKYKNEYFTYYDYLQNCKSDDPVSSYSSYLFLDDLSEIDEFFECVSSLGESRLQVTSTALEIKQTYGTFISSFSTTLVVFVAIAFVGINLILGMISLSTFIENKKNTAIMTCLGARNSSVYDLYIKENLFVILLSFISSVFLANYLQNFLNKILFTRFSLNNLIDIPFRYFSNIPFGLIFILFAIAILFSIIFTMTPMVIYRRKAITDELRDE